MYITDGKVQRLNVDLDENQMLHSWRSPGQIEATTYIEN